MEYNYNLQEAVSEECYSDIISLVNEYLAGCEIDEEHLVDAIESGLHRHGPGILKATVKGVGNTISGAKNAAVSGLANSSSKLTKLATKIPGVKAAVVGHIKNEHRSALNKNRQTLNNRQQNIRNKFANQMTDSEMISNPQYKTAAQNTIKNNATNSMINAQKAYQQGIQAAKVKRQQQMNNLR